jgi:hypothetical protein
MSAVLEKNTREVLSLYCPREKICQYVDITIIIVIIASSARTTLLKYSGFYVQFVVSCFACTVSSFITIAILHIINRPNFHFKYIFGEWIVSVCTGEHIYVDPVDRASLRLRI